MVAVLFDALKMVETLEAGGFTEQQARAMTTALGDAAAVAEIATRSDVMDLCVGMKHDFDALSADFAASRGDIKAEMAAFKSEIRVEMAAFKREIGAEMAAFKSQMHADFSAFRTEFKHELASLEQRTTIRMGGMMVVLAGVLSAAFHYLR